MKEGIKARYDLAARPQAGAAAIVFVLMIAVMLGFMGFALDLAQIYNRRLELQSVAEAAAAAAAGQLTGTSAGVANALTQASAAAGRLRYQYNKQQVAWLDPALRFSSDPAAPDDAWLDAGAAQAAPLGLQYVKADTSLLAAATGAVPTAFMKVLSPGLASTSTSGRAIAGRPTIMVTPLAICAMSTNPAVSRSNAGSVELVEYGFRRGVAYNLMQLNPNANVPANFLVDPIDPVGTLGSAANMATAVVGPFVCAGSMQIGRLSGGTITVQSPFPLGQLFQQLNSRFDQYPGGLCSPNAAPPDFNIKSYVYNNAIPWMGTARDGQASDMQTDANKLWTRADLVPHDSDTNTAPMYGPLWSYAKAVPFAAYTPGVAEPTAGYSTFTTASWPTLYSPGVPTAVGYPANTPYLTNAGANFLAPSAVHRPGQRNRRVLNISLLSCPVGAGATASASVLAVGKFFMTVPATATTLFGEFAGTVPEQSLGGPVVMYP
jgi:Flp pilus assembly protein TadG